MNNPVNFELAKLLKEKGFDEWTQTWHQRGEGISGYVEGKRDFYNRKGDVYTSAPTIAEVVMWLYEKHGIWILVDWFQTKWCFSVIDVKEEIIKKASGDRWKERNSGVYLKTELDFNSPTEAYEAAIEYTLKNLI